MAGTDQDLLEFWLRHIQAYGLDKDAMSYKIYGYKVTWSTILNVSPVLFHQTHHFNCLSQSLFEDSNKESDSLATITNSSMVPSRLFTCSQFIDRQRPQQEGALVSSQTCAPDGSKTRTLVI